MPELDEGTMTIRVTMNPSISMAESKRIAARLEARLEREETSAAGEPLLAAHRLAEALLAGSGEDE